jgi:hypothetical protein
MSRLSAKSNTRALMGFILHGYDFYINQGTILRPHLSNRRFKAQSIIKANATSYKVNSTGYEVVNIDILFIITVVDRYISYCVRFLLILYKDRLTPRILTKKGLSNIRGSWMDRLWRIGYWLSYIVDSR